jgi:hypothetical protein
MKIKRSIEKEYLEKMAKIKNNLDQEQPIFIHAVKIRQDLLTDIYCDYIDMMLNKHSRFNNNNIGSFMIILNY